MERPGADQEAGPFLFHSARLYGLRPATRKGLLSGHRMGRFSDSLRSLGFRTVRSEVRDGKENRRELLRHVRGTPNHRFRESLDDLRCAAIERALPGSWPIVLFRS